MEGVDYHFVSDEEFEAMKARGEFLETAGVYGKKYGTPKGPVLEQLRRGRLVILEIDVQGAIQVKKHVPEAFALFVRPPSESELLRRLSERKRESAELIEKRFRAAKDEVALAESCGVYDVFIVNDSVERSIKEAVATVQLRRAQRRSGGKKQ